jgi:CheY-like chemotaxis protein
MPCFLSKEPKLDVLVPESTDANNSLKILLAEDNIVNQKVALKMLDKLGYESKLASNGLEVLRAIDEEEFDIVLMDVQMPELDGIEATRIIRDHEQGQQPYIIAMTANAMKGDREVCIEAGMNDFISKPITLDSLQQGLKAFPGHQ